MQLELKNFYLKNTYFGTVHNFKNSFVKKILKNTVLLYKI